MMIMKRTSGAKIKCPGWNSSPYESCDNSKEFCLSCSCNKSYLFVVSQNTTNPPGLLSIPTGGRTGEYGVG